ncbi:hypothetical protein GCM10022631_07410 [Deinococcus rubellus]
MGIAPYYRPVSTDARSPDHRLMRDQAGSISTIGVNPTHTLTTGLTYLLRGPLNQ